MEEEFGSLEAENGWSALFQRLHHTARTNASSQGDGKKPGNLPRNRYRDVIPIDSHRVKLEDDENDYINASFVKVEDVKRSYILSQGPLQHTCHHFWQMIWEQKTAGIVMLNKCIERGSNKCFPYWPYSFDDPVMEVGSYKIELVSIEDMHSYRMSRLQLENLESDDEDEEPRAILHFHYTRWPDFGVPRTPDDFLDFLYNVRSSGALNEDVGPCVVHCSAGIGRSGTFCLVDVCLKKINDSGGDLNINLQSILLDMRKQRLGLVQTADQLRFCYIAILQAALPDDDEEEVEESDSEEEEEEPEVHNGYRGSVDIYKDHQFDDDLPPPIPPRYPDMLQNHTPSPPPPPPPSLPPPGPPEYGTNQDEERNDLREEDEVEELLVRYEKSVSHEKMRGEGPSSLDPWYINGGPDMVQPGEKLLEDTEEEPPSPPPRVESVRNSPPQADHFLGVGRGGEHEKTAPPCLPPPTQVSPSHPPRPQSENAPLNSDFSEEEALINELNELEKIVSQYPRDKEEQETSEKDKKAEESRELRQREREDRQQRLQDKVSSMQTKLRREETSEWSVPWLFVGIVAIVGYCAYYYLS